MIKVNLLSERKQVKVKPGSSLQADGMGAGRNLALIAVLLLGVLIAAGWWWSLDGKVTHWQGELEKADQELARLQESIKKAEESERQKQLLLRKIKLITELKKQQAVPVHIMDQLSRSLPEFLWLDSMQAVKNDISIRGKATTYNAVSNFYSNLAESGFFSKVELGRTFEVPEGVSFSLTCSFSTAAPAGAPAEQPQS